MKKILPIVWNDYPLSKYLLRKSIFNRSVDIDVLNTDKIYEFVSNLDRGMDRYCTKMIIVSDPKNLKKLFTQIVRAKISSEHSVSTTDSRSDASHSSVSPTYLCLLDSTENVVSQFVQELDRVTFNTKGKKCKITDVIRVLDNSKPEDEILRSVGCSISGISRYTDMIRSFIDIDDLITEMQIDGYKFHSNRDISRLQRVKYRNLNLTILINDVTQKSLSDGTFGCMFTDIKNHLESVNPMTNDYLIGHVDYHILLADTVPSAPTLDIESYINSINRNQGNNINTIKSTISVHNFTQENDQKDIDDMTISLKNKQIEDLPKVVKCIKSLYNLYRFQEVHNLKDPTTDYVMIYRYPDESRICACSKEIVLSNEIDRAIKHKKNQYIAVHDSSFVFGTKNIMRFFMLLYQYYGYYKPWLNVRRFQTNGIMSSAEYYGYEKSRYMDYNIQMIEHIMHFTDVMMTTIQKVQVPERSQKIVIIIGSQIPDILTQDLLIGTGYTIQRIDNDSSDELFAATHKDNLDQHIITQCQNIIKNQNVIGVLFWRYVPSSELLSCINSYVNIKILHLCYRSDGTDKIDESVKINTRMIIEDTRFTEGCYEYMNQTKESGNAIQSFPLHHQYIDSSIDSHYDKKEEILSDLLIFVSEQSDDLYKDIVKTITESDIMDTSLVNVLKYDRTNHLNKFDEEQLVQNIKHQRIIMTDDPWICMIAMCHRTLVVIYQSEVHSDIQQKPKISYAISLETFSKVIKQLKITIKQSRMNMLDNMLDEAYCVAFRTTWHRFFMKNVLESVETTLSDDHP